MLLSALALGVTAPHGHAAEAPGAPFVVEGEALVRGARASEGTVKLESMRDHGDGWSGWAQLRWRPFGEGQTLGLVLVAPADGTYRVDAAWTRGPDAGDVRVSVRGRMFEPTLEGWSPRVDLAGPVRLGEVRLVRGANDVEIRVVGHDARSNGYRFGLDRLVLTPLGVPGAEPAAAEGAADAADVATPVEPTTDVEEPTTEPSPPARTGPVAVPLAPATPPADAAVREPAAEAPDPDADAPLPPGPLPGDPEEAEPLPTFDEGVPVEPLPPPETTPTRPPEPATPAAPEVPTPAPAEPGKPAEAPCGVMGQAAAGDEGNPVVDPDAEVPVAEPPAGAADVPPEAPPLHTAPAGTEPPAAPDVVEPAAPTPAVGPTPPAPGPTRTPAAPLPTEVPTRPAPAPEAGPTPAEPTPAPQPAKDESKPQVPVEVPAPEVPPKPPGPTPAERRLLFEAIQGLERYFEGKPRGAGWAKALKLAEVREALVAKTPDDAVASALARRLDKFPPGPAYEALLAEPAFVRLTRALEPFRTSDDDSDDWSTADR